MKELRGAAALVLSLVLTSLLSSSLNAWVRNGTPVCTASNWQWWPKLISDGQSGAIVTWHDLRSGSADIYAQRLCASGAARWTSDGVPVCTADADQLCPQIATDGCQGAIIAWWDNRDGRWDLYAQRVNALGIPLWTENGVVVCSLTNLATVSEGVHGIVPDGNGGAILIWVDNRNGNIDLYAQKITSAGVGLWEANGVPVCTAPGDQEQFRVIAEGAGGATVAWTDYRHTNSDIYIQRIDSEGRAQWGIDGLAACSYLQYQSDPQLAPDGSGGVIVTWWDCRQDVGDIFAQRIRSDGTAAWTADGISVCTAQSDQGYYNLQIVPSDSGSAIITWEDERNGDADVYAQRIDSSGTARWLENGVPICTAPGDQATHPEGSFALQMVPDAHGGAVISWIDNRGSDLDIYAQAVEPDGSIRWALDGIVICTAPGGQDFINMAWDSYEGAILTWVDFRNGVDTDIYAATLGASGPIAAALQQYSARYTARGVEIDWSLSEVIADCSFRILRARGSQDNYQELAGASIHGDGLHFSFLDENCDPGAKYWYRVEAGSDKNQMVSIELGPVTIPMGETRLYQNSPNPFNPSTTIRYYVAETGGVRLEIYDISGRRLASLVNARQEKGYHAVEWRGKGEDGRVVASGVYFYRLRAGKKTLVKEMVLLR